MRIKLVLLTIILLSTSSGLFAQDSSGVRRLGSIENDWNVEGVVVSGDYAFLACARAGLRIIDINNPEQLIEIGSYELLNCYVNSIVVAGNYAFWSGDWMEEETRFHGFKVIDISDPSQPEEVGSYELEEDVDYIHGLAIQGNFLYCAGISLNIMDISDPTQPREVGCYPDFGYKIEAIDIAVSDNYVYLNLFAVIGVSEDVNDTDRNLNRDQYHDGFCIMDVSDPSQPYEIGYLGSPLCGPLTVNGDYAYLGGDALYIIDVSDPAQPRETGNCNLPGNALDLAIDGDFAYLANRNSGLRVVNINDPENPYEVGFYDRDVHEQAVAVQGNYAYFAEWHCFSIYDCSGALAVPEVSHQPTAYNLLSAYPNPFNSTTTIEYALPYASEVSLNLYNLAGQRIETLVNGRMQAGIHLTMLDAGYMASGLYFLKLEGSGQSFTQKVMLVK